MTSEGHTAPIRLQLINIKLILKFYRYYKSSILILMLICIRCLQADHWRVVSAADDKTIKVCNFNKNC